MWQTAGRLRLCGGSAIARAAMVTSIDDAGLKDVGVATLSPQPVMGGMDVAEPEMLLVAKLPYRARSRQAIIDLTDGWRLRRLCWTLGWLDIKGRYHGSMLGPLWLTLSTAVMVATLGVLYSTLFNMNLQEYLPFLALSLVLWGYVQTLVSESCTCFTGSEGMIRSIRMPFSLYGARVVVRNILVLLHNVVVIVVVFGIFRIWPGLSALAALPALALWLADSLAVAMLLGTFCARFRDVPPIVGSVMQIAFFISPIIWKPELVAARARFLPFNPFFSLFEIVRGPLLGQVPGLLVWASALFYSLLVCGASWALFVRVRGRIAFWI
jgi:lipopolysaccharide transport system permease protein